MDFAMEIKISTLEMVIKEQGELLTKLKAEEARLKDLLLKLKKINKKNEKDEQPPRSNGGRNEKDEQPPRSNGGRNEKDEQPPRSIGGVNDKDEQPLRSSEGNGKEEQTPHSSEVNEKEEQSSRSNGGVNEKDEQPPRSGAVNEKEEQSLCSDGRVNEKDDQPPRFSGGVNEKDEQAAFSNGEVNEKEEQTLCSDGRVNEKDEEPPRSSGGVNEKDEQQPCSSGTVNEKEEQSPCSDGRVNEKDEEPPRSSGGVNEKQEQPSLPSGGVNEKEQQPPRSSGVVNKKDHQLLPQPSGVVHQVSKPPYSSLHSNASPWFPSSRQRLQRIPYTPYHWHQPRMYYPYPSHNIGFYPIFPPLYHAPPTQIAPPTLRITSLPDNNANKDDESEKMYKIDVQKIKSSEDTRTTLMISNIPIKYTSKMLFFEIEKDHTGIYDFLYLPINFEKKCHVGYAFINMLSPKLIIPFYEDFHNKKLDKYLGTLTYARIQGKDEIVKHFQSSINQDNSSWPILFRSKLVEDTGVQEHIPSGNFNIITRHKDGSYSGDFLESRNGNSDEKQD